MPTPDEQLPATGGGSGGWGIALLHSVTAPAPSVNPDALTDTVAPSVSPVFGVTVICGAADAAMVAAMMRPADSTPARSPNRSPLRPTNRPSDQRVDSSTPRRRRSDPHLTSRQCVWFR